MLVCVCAFGRLNAMQMGAKILVGTMHFKQKQHNKEKGKTGKDDPHRSELIVSNCIVDMVDSVISFPLPFDVFLFWSARRLSLGASRPDPIGCHVAHHKSKHTLHNAGCQPHI